MSFSFQNYLIEKSEPTMRLSLDAITSWLEYLGRPDQHLKIVLIGGTNGKGSTCGFLKQLLITHGYKVGLNSSPHLETVHERISIQNNNISDEDLSNVLSRIDEIEKTTPLPVLTYFEVITLAALLYFIDQGVEFALFEVGLGGRLDATNALKRMAAGIASISLDHTAILGETHELIAQEKAAIFKPNQINCLAKQKNIQAQQVIEAYGNQIGAIIRKHTSDFSFTMNDQGFSFKSKCLRVTDVALGLKGEHQGVNASLALDLFSQIVATNTISQDRVAKSLLDTRLSGRFEKWVDPKSATQIFLDIAHNDESVESFIDTLLTKTATGTTKPVNALIIGMAKDKNHIQCFQQLDRLTVPIYICPIDSSRSWDVFQIKETHKTVVGSFRTIEEAYHWASHQKSVAVIGSFYLVGPMRSLLKQSFQLIQHAYRGDS